MAKPTMPPISAKGLVVAGTLAAQAQQGVAAALGAGSIAFGAGLGERA
jgi:hypothetical protein